MKYEQTRAEFYKGEIEKMADQLAGYIDEGLTVELSRSRSGIKLFVVKRRHEVVRKGE